MRVNRGDVVLVDYPFTLIKMLKRLERGDVPFPGVAAPPAPGPQGSASEAEQERRRLGNGGGAKGQEAGSVQAAAARGDELGDEGLGRAVVLQHIVGGCAVDEEVAVRAEHQASGSEQATAARGDEVSDEGPRSAIVLQHLGGAAAVGPAACEKVAVRAEH
jgi:hypothetical protein